MATVSSIIPDFDANDPETHAPALITVPYVSVFLAVLIDGHLTLIGLVLFPFYKSESQHKGIHTLKSFGVES